MSPCSSAPDFPSYPPCPIHRGSSLAPLTCLHFLRSPLFSRVHCFLLCMSRPYGNKSHSQLVTKARQIKTMQSFFHGVWRPSGFIRHPQIRSWNQMLLGPPDCSQPQWSRDETAGGQLQCDSSEFRVSRGLGETVAPGYRQVKSGQTQCYADISITSKPP